MIMSGQKVVNLLMFELEFMVAKQRFLILLFRFHMKYNDFELLSELLLLFELYC